MAQNKFTNHIVNNRILTTFKKQKRLTYKFKWNFKKLSSQNNLQRKGEARGLRLPGYKQRRAATANRVVPVWTGATEVWPGELDGEHKQTFASTSRWLLHRPIVSIQWGKTQSFNEQWLSFKLECHTFKVFCNQSSNRSWRERWIDTCRRMKLST